MRKYLAELLLRASKKLNPETVRRDELLSDGFIEIEPLNFEPAKVIPIKSQIQKNYEKELRENNGIDFDQYFQKYQ